MIDFQVHYVSVLPSQKTGEYSDRITNSINGGNIEQIDFLYTSEYNSRLVISTNANMSTIWLT